MESKSTIWLLRMAVLFSLGACWVEAAGVPFAADGHHSGGQAIVAGETYRLALEAGVRQQQGTALEIVYIGPFVLSELTWDIKDLLFVGGALRYELRNRLALVASYWEAVTEGNGGMTDYDFVIPGIWSDFSDGPVDINSASMFDIQADWVLWRPRDTSLHGLVGYRWLHWDWSQYGGSYIYSEGGFRNARGTFPIDQNGINYEQTFNIPYLGVALNRRWRNLYGAAYMHYSPVARAEALDEHVVRELVFEDSFSSADYHAAGMLLAYRPRERWHVVCAWDWHDIPEIRGDMLITDLAAGTVESIRGAAGIANQAWSLSFSGGYRF